MAILNLLQETDRLLHYSLEHVTELTEDELCLSEILRAGVNAYRIGYLHELMEDVQCAVEAAENMLEEAYENSDRLQMELFNVKEPQS